MISVILCGGAGSRLWPVSREEHPKPFIRLPDGHSFLQKAFLRGINSPNVRTMLTITRKELYFKAADEFLALNSPVAANYILEPFGRNTAPAIVAAAMLVERRFGADTLMLVLPADHLIEDEDAFGDAVKRAAQLAAEDCLVTFGIKPSQPETGYGYIEADGEKVLRFVEKPNEENARKYVEMGNFYWNAGMFCFKAKTMLEEMDRHAPEVVNAVEHCMMASLLNDGKLELDGDTFAFVPDISIDYAVMEKSDRMMVVPCDIGWSDVGSWMSLCALQQPDKNNNRVLGDEQAFLQQTSNCDIYGDGRLVATLGLDNLLIVDTADALLVADKSKAQEVKDIYNSLKKDEHETYKQHRTVFRPWGTYTVLEAGPRFKIKRLEIKPGGTLSLQVHHHRSEHWVVVSGMAEVTCGEKVYLINTNESTYIKAGDKHRVLNPGLVPLIIIEVQSGEYLGEDDIVRFEDTYGRA